VYKTDLEQGHGFIFDAHASVKSRSLTAAHG